MIVQNPDFELAGAMPGEALHWTLVTHTSQERIAGFGPPPHRAAEEFERWWEVCRSFGADALAQALFDPLPDGREDFEEAWSNDHYRWEFPTGHVASAEFNGGPAEDLESGWQNEGYAASWSEITAAVCVFHDQRWECFEIDSYARTWGEAPSFRAVFDADQTTETFMVEWPAITNI